MFPGYNEINILIANDSAFQNKIKNKSKGAKQWAKKRYRVFKRDGDKCVKCSSKKKITIDHKIPVSMGGTDRYENLQTLCQKCNSKKGNKINT